MIYDKILSHNIRCEQLFEIPIVALFCSANWCPPCRGFIPILDKFYTYVNKSNYLDTSLPQNVGLSLPQDPVFIFQQQLYLKHKHEMEASILQHANLVKQIEDQRLLGREAIDEFTYSKMLDEIEQRIYRM